MSEQDAAIGTFTAEKRLFEPSPRKDKRAIVWESEPGEVRTLTYGELYEHVDRGR